jgi:membrane dipeptidase
MNRPSYDLPLPALMNAGESAAPALEMAGLLLRLERSARDALRLCRTVAEIRACLAEGRIAAVMHMEGAEAIGPDLDALYLLHAAGLRSLGPVWSRPTIFGHGVPFRFPGDPDTGPGLTAAGRDLVRACEELRMVIDLSHLNAAGFADVAALTSAPLVATHSNAHALCPSTRNLTDRQLDQIAERDGMVGLNFAACFLRPDGRSSADTAWEPLLRHLDHLIWRIGEDRVGFGSDFDGATIPAGIGDVAGLPALQAALRAHGYDARLMAKLCHGNWLAALERVWGE